MPGQLQLHWCPTADQINPKPETLHAVFSGPDTLDPIAHNYAHSCTRL